MPLRGALMLFTTTLAPHASAGVNDLLYRYCLDEKITFTRSHPYKKNDQAHVEQKNWPVVRVIPLAMTAGKQIKSFPFSKVSMMICGSTSTSFSHLSN